MTLSRPFVRPCILTVILGSLVYAVLGVRIAEMELFVALAVAGTSSGIMLVLRPPQGASGIAELTLAAFGIALLAPFSVLALDVDVQRFAPVVAIVLITGSYVYRPSLRLVLSLWTIAVWGITLVWSGVTDLPVLILHLGGASLVVAATVRVADILGQSLDEAAETRREAEGRADLLGSMLLTNSLEADEVLGAACTGLVEAGFDRALIRTIDPIAGLARLVRGVSSGGSSLPETVPIDLGLLGVAVRERRTVLVDDLDQDPRAINNGYGLRGTVVIPLLDGGEVIAVMSAASLTGPLAPEQIRAAEWLAAQAERALVRARAFAADGRTVLELRRLDARTQDFVSTVSHELRTPLTVIDGLGQTLLARWDELSTETREDLLQRIDANADRLAVMVQSLLDSSAFEFGEFELRRRPVHLRGAFVQLTDRLATVTASHPIDLRIPHDLRVEVDPGLFEHVIENLLTNVTKHTPPGTRVEVSGLRRGDRARIVVADDGPGIAVVDLPHVLDRFYRGGEPTERAAGGLGLGLALASQIVRAHGSELQVESVEGRGTRFSFEVPAVP